MKTIQQTNEKVYLGMEVLLTGRTISRHAMIRFGCVIVDSKTKELERFQISLRMPPGSLWEDEWRDTYWVKHADVLQDIVHTARSPQEAMSLFVLWIDDMDERYKNRLILISGKMNVDVAWINLYLSCFTNRPALNYAFDFVHHGFVWRPILDMYSIVYGALAARSKKGEGMSKLEKPWWFNKDGDVLHGATCIATSYVLFLQSIAIE